MSFQQCKELFRLGLIESLDLCQPLLRGLIDSADDLNHGLGPINGLALDIFPWHTQAGIAFRVESDPQGNHQLGDWEHYEDFFDVAVVESEALGDAAEYAANAWNNPPGGTNGGAIAHLIFLAGAEALLDESVERKLSAIIGVDLKEFNSPIEFVVFDPDQKFKGNYCDLVRAMRLASQTMPLWP